MIPKNCPPFQTVWGIFHQITKAEIREYDTLVEIHYFVHPINCVIYLNHEKSIYSRT